MSDLRGPDREEADREEADREEAEFAERVGNVLRDRELGTDNDVLERLSAARREAVAVADVRKGRSGLSRPWGFGIGGSAATVALLLAVFLDSGEQKYPPLDDVDFTVAQEAELLEDLEFVAWMLAVEADDSSGDMGAAGDSLLSS